MENNNNIPEFWYESNAVWGNVKTIKDLQEKIYHQTNRKNCGIFDNIDEFLDNSYQNSDNSLDFGTRREHDGKKTLRQFLIENNFDFSLLENETEK